MGSLSDLVLYRNGKDSLSQVGISRMKNSTKLFINLVYLCCAIGLAVFILTLLGRLVGAGLAWNVKEDFPFSFKDVWICLELSWLGLPAGLIIWFFYHR